MNFRSILAIPTLSLLLLTTFQNSFGFSLLNQPNSFIAITQGDWTAFIEWTKSEQQLSGQLEFFALDLKTIKSQSSNFSFSGIQDKSNISLNLSDGRIITGSFHGDKLFLAFPSQNGMLDQVEFKPGTIKEYNLKVSLIRSKKYSILAYNHYVSLLNDAKTRLKALPNLDSPHQGGFLENYGNLLANMRAIYQKGDQAVQMTLNCYRRESIKSYTLSQISNGYSMANNAQSLYKSRIRDVFENDIKMVKSDLVGASQNLQVIQSDRNIKGYIPALQKVDLQKYYQDFYRIANGQIEEAVSKFEGVKRKVALYDQEAKKIYDSSQQEFHFSVCPP